MEKGAAVAPCSACSANRFDLYDLIYTVLELWQAVHKNLFLTRNSRDWSINGFAWTLMGQLALYIGLSFFRQQIRMSCGLAQMLVCVQHGCRLTCNGTDGPFCLDFAGAWAKGNWSSQNWLTVSGFSEKGVDDFRSHDWSVRCPDWSLINSTCTLQTTGPLALLKSETVAMHN